MFQPSRSSFARAWGAALVLAAPFVGALPAARAATFSVSNLNDAGAGSLRAAITLANASPGADAIDASTQNGAIGLRSPLPLLSGALSIQGAGADSLTVRRDSASTFRVFAVATGANVKLSGLSVIGGGGDTMETGGGIASSGTLSLVNCTFIGNSARRGGALFSSGAVTMDGCAFAVNSAIGGGAISSSNGFLTVTNSIFDRNTASGDGGAFVLLHTRTTIARSSFSDNRAGAMGNGGALFSSAHFELSHAAVAVQNCTFAGNSAGRQGGALWNRGGALQLQNATITRNSSPAGAGVWSEGDTATTFTFVAGSILAGNSASSSSVGNDADSGAGKNSFVSRGYNLVGGGSGRAGFSKVGDRSGLTFDALRLNGTLADGGAVLYVPFADSPAVDAIPTSSLGTPVDQRGKARPQGKAGDIGAVEIDPVKNVSTFVVNSTDGGSDGSCTTDNCTLREAVEAANALSVQSAAQTATISFDPKVFSTPKTIYVGQTANFDSYFGTALVVTGRMKIVGPGAGLLTIAAAGEVRPLLIQSGATATISGVTMSGGNPFGGRGGAISNAGTLDVTNCAFSGNRGNNGAGGAIYNAGALSVRACSFTGNSTASRGFDTVGIPHAINGGGAICNEGTLSVRDSTISNNVDGSQLNPSGGGGIANAGTATVEHSTIAGNKTSTQGGGITSISSGTLTVLGCTLSGNSAGGFDPYSGAEELDYPGTGGGLYVEGTLVLRNSTVAGNRGGGVWTGGAATIANCTITGNRNSKTYGNGVFVNSGNTLISGSVIADNENNTYIPEVIVNSGQVVSGGFNFVGYDDQHFHQTGDRAGGSLSPDSPSVTVLDPRLSMLADNGGGVLTIAPLPDSPLINTGDPAFNAATLLFDERGPGFARVVGGRIDIGAFETQGFSLPRPSAKSKPAPSAGSS